jgi:hypothetical protein
MVPAARVKALVQKSAGATLTSPTSCPSPARYGGRPSSPAAVRPRVGYGLK